tara:strand:- start:488 stop:886 length:399 start_codon:yes stop_codon:yes gene_type:complete
MYKVKKSKVHGSGVFASRKILANTKIIQYVGEKILKSEGNKVKKSKYINHSCNPNCEVEIKKGEIWIKSIKSIKKGEELCYDYGFEFDKDDYMDHVCKCNSKNCVGYIISQDDFVKYKKFLEKKIKLLSKLC